MFGLIAVGLSAISAGCSAIGGALGAACGAIGGSLGSMLNMGGGLITTACNIIGVIGKVFNLIPQQANIENDMTEMGARIEKSDVKSDAFSSAKEYIDHLRSNIEISREDINALSDEKKKIHQIVGASLIAKGVSENYTMDIPSTFWVEVALSALSSGQVQKMLGGYQALGIPADLKAFSERSLSLADNKSVYGILSEALQGVDSDKTPKTPEDLITKRNSEHEQGARSA
jgi:hypothetical protein